MTRGVSFAKLSHIHNITSGYTDHHARCSAFLQTMEGEGWEDIRHVRHRGRLGTPSAVTSLREKDYQLSRRAWTRNWHTYADLSQGHAAWHSTHAPVLLLRGRKRHEKGMENLVWRGKKEIESKMEKNVLYPWSLTQPHYRTSAGAPQTPSPSFATVMSTLSPLPVPSEPPASAMPCYSLPV